MKLKVLFLMSSFFFLSPFSSFAGFPEGKNGYDLEKLEKSFRLPCDEIGNDDWILYDETAYAFETIFRF